MSADSSETLDVLTLQLEHSEQLARVAAQASSLALKLEVAEQRAQAATVRANNLESQNLKLQRAVMRLERLVGRQELKIVELTELSEQLGLRNTDRPPQSEQVST